MTVQHETLGSGIALTAIQTDKFKSATLSLTFLTPLRAQTASVNALVPYVLRRGCKALPTMGEISARLEELYGGALEPVVRKKGETQCLGLIGSFLDDAYTLDGESVLEPAVELLGQLALEPVTQEGVFREEYVAGERENLLQAIRSQMNDKRSYALLRLIQEMCGQEHYGVDRLGREENVKAITPQGAWELYEELLAMSEIEIHYCGSANASRVREALGPMVEALKARRDRYLKARECEVRSHPAHSQPREVVERMDVTQGKLAMGFRTGGMSIWSEEYPAMLVFNALYGGTATSKLFMNVREKLSLCYYASSALDVTKGIAVVSSGVEFDKMAQAQEEILAQLDDIRSGNFTDEELTSARQAVISTNQSTLDSRAQLEQYWLTAAVTGHTETPRELNQRLEAVTAEDVIHVAKALELDTVYRLVGKEG